MKVLLLLLLLCIDVSSWGLQLKSDSSSYQGDTLKKADPLEVKMRPHDPGKGEMQIIKKRNTRSFKPKSKNKKTLTKFSNNISEGDKPGSAKIKKSSLHKGKPPPKYGKSPKRKPKKGFMSNPKKLLEGRASSWLQDLNPALCSWLCNYSLAENPYSNVISLLKNTGSCCFEKELFSKGKKKPNFSNKKHKTSKHSSIPLFVALPLFPLNESPRADEAKAQHSNSNIIKPDEAESDETKSDVTESPDPQSTIKLPPPTIPPSPKSCPPQTISMEGCGFSTPQRVRVVNGLDASPGEFPWAVLLFAMKYNAHGLNSGQYGGTLITSGWIVSAAHCFYRKETYDAVYANIGSIRMPKDYTSMKLIFQIILHPEYSHWDMNNDIALLQLVEYVSFTDRSIIPICLATSEDEGQMNSLDPSATVVGWGFLKQHANKLSQSLQKVDLDVITLEACRNAYSDRTHPITEGNMCTYTKGKDACQGDSGSGLYHLLPDERWVQVGVVSWGIGCAQEGNPGVYTRIVDKLQWITTVINTKTC